MSGSGTIAGQTTTRTPRRALLEHALRDRLQQAANTESAPADTMDWPRIVPDPARRHEPFQLTQIQQAYLLGRNATFELGGVGIHGYIEVVCQELDLPRLERAWARVVERHDMMRAVVQADGRQRILPSVPPYQIAEIDLRGASGPEIESTLNIWRERLSHQVFSPETWPLFEIVALRLDERTTRLLISEDAIHVDLVSSALILDEWIRLYRDPQTVLPPIELSYRDYVLALHALPQTQVWRAAADYWRTRAGTLPPPPDLPRVPIANPPRFERLELVLAASAWQRLRQRAAADNLSSAAVLLGVYADVLGHWSSTVRFTLNVTTYNRLPLHADVGQLAGDFTSMVLLEVDRSRRGSFVEHARAIQRQLWSDLEHHGLSGVEVLRDLAARRGDPTAALMPFVFTSSLGNAGYRSLRGLGTIDYAVTQTPQVLIDQQVFEDDGALVVSWDVVSSAFPAGMADAMFQHGSRLITRLAEDPACWTRPTEAPAVTRPVPVTRPLPDGLLHEYVDRHAREAPGRAAIVSGRETLTYGVLAARTNQMARRLRACGAEPDRPIAILAARGWQAIAATIAIGKAGAPYLPLDPASPRARHLHMLDDASVRIAVTDDPGAFAGTGVTAVTFDGIAGESSDPVESVQQPSNLAYVMYTSGSTGAPKGVLIEQRSVTNRMQDIVTRLGLSSHDVAFAVTALHHDLSVFDIFGLLAFAGGSLVVPDAETMRDPSGWGELLATHGVTVWNSVPAYLEMLIRCTPAAGCGRSMTHVLLSGDRIPIGLPAEIRRLMPAAQVISLGGPTETTVWDIWHPIQDDDVVGERIPYGVPLTNATYYVMKDNLDECPVWTPGELCIAGAGLARGYLGAPETTARRFVQHPDTGERLFRSGDLGRLLPTGDIDIVGRRDRQVKVRGHRIELDEIEAAVSSAPGVLAAAVDLGGESDALELVAYVTLTTQRAEEGVTPLGDRRLPDEIVAACAQRQSHRHFSPEAVSRDAFGRLLACLANYAPAGALRPRHLYPSAGTLYPVQTYVHIKAGRVDEVAEGWHRYEADRHVLTCVSRSALDASAHHERNRGLFDDCAFSLMLVADLDAIAATYAEYARDFALIEAGAMSQLLMLAAGPLDLGLCPIAAIELEAVASSLSLGPVSLGAGRQLVHSLCGGRIRPRAYELPTSPDSTAARIEAIRASLRHRLPPHMIPSRFIGVDRLPLSANGKIDRAALKQMRAATQTARVASKNAPSGDLVSAIRECWETVLGRTGIAEDERVFETGADSFQTVRVWLAITQRIGVEFELVEMFRNPTIASLAAHLAGCGDPHAEIAAGQRRAEIRRRTREQRYN